MELIDLIFDWLQGILKMRAHKTKKSDHDWNLKLSFTDWLLKRFCKCCNDYCKKVLKRYKYLFAKTGSWKHILWYLEILSLPRINASPPFEACDKMPFGPTVAQLQIWGPKVRFICLLVCFSSSVYYCICFCVLFSMFVYFFCLFKVPWLDVLPNTLWVILGPPGRWVSWAILWPLGFSG